MAKQTNIALPETENETLELVQRSIIVLRGKQVLLDFQLAAMYGVETKALNQAVRRNIERFPEDFMFRMNPQELAAMRSQFVTSSPQSIENQQKSLSDTNILQERRKASALPYAFTEQDELDNIYAAIGALSIKQQEPPKPRNPIGFR